MPYSKRNPTEAEMNITAGFIARSAYLLETLTLTPDHVILASHIRVGRQEKKHQTLSSLARVTGWSREKVKTVAKMQPNNIRLIEKANHTIVTFPLGPIPQWVYDFYRLFAAEIRRSGTEFLKIDPVFRKKMLAEILKIAETDQELESAITAWTCRKPSP